MQRIRTDFGFLYNFNSLQKSGFYGYNPSLSVLSVLIRVLLGMGAGLTELLYI